MPPPLARAFAIEHVAAFDDEALRTFVAPLIACRPDTAQVGAALWGPEHDELAERVARCLDTRIAHALRTARDGDRRGADDTTTEARRLLVGRLFWPLLYWHAPALYDALIAGEELHPGILGQLELDGRDVADLGCGTGRFTLPAARRARSVIAVDAVPPLLDRLCRRLGEQGTRNVEVRRGSLAHLPLADASVDVAVACSSLGARPPFGGEAALDEIRRVLRPNGLGAVIWPDEPDWFTARGLTHVAFPGRLAHRFRSPASARRLCRLFYGEAAADWVRVHDAAAVPYSVLGTRPPADLCLLRTPGGVPDAAAIATLVPSPAAGPR